MRSITLNFIFILLISCTVFLSCEKPPTPTSSTECIGLLSKIQILDANHSLANYITKFSRDNNQDYTFQFIDGSSITIEQKCVDLLKSDPENWELQIYFSGVPERKTYQLLGTPEVSINTEASPWNPLAAMITVSAPIPLRIGFTIKGESPVVQYFSEFKKVQDLNILGLYPDLKNEVLVHVLDEKDEIIITYPVEIETEKVEIDFSEINIIIANKEKMESGFHFISSRKHVDPNIPYMIDSEGIVRWFLDFREHPVFENLGYDVGMEKLQNGNLYFGDWSTDKIYEIDFLGNVIDSWDLLTYDYHHNVEEKPNGNFLVTVTDVNSVHLNGKATVEDIIIEIDRNTKAIINTWDLKESLDEYRTSLIDNLNSPNIDWAHANAVIHDPQDDGIIVSCRTQGLIKLTVNNEVQWIMAPHKGWGNNRRGDDLNNYLLQPLDASGVNISDDSVLNGEENHVDFEWNWYQHAPFIMEDGSIILFDNGGAQRNYGNAGIYSRAVAYDINEEQKTIQQLWTYGAERGTETYASFLSDVDILKQTKNVFFCPGANVDHGDGSFGGKLIELDFETKEVYFEARILGGGGQFHRAERMQFY